MPAALMFAKSAVCVGPPQITELFPPEPPPPFSDDLDLLQNKDMGIFAKLHLRPRSLIEQRGSDSQVLQLQSLVCTVFHLDVTPFSSVALPPRPAPYPGRPFPSPFDMPLWR